MTNGEWEALLARLRAEMAKFDSIINTLWDSSMKAAANVKITKDKERHRILNSMQLHYFLSLTDLKVGIKYLTASSIIDDVIGMGYFARILTVSCCSLLDADKGGMTKENLPQYLKKSKQSQEIGGQILAQLDKVDLIEKEYGKELRLIRDKIAAHKDGSGYTQLERLKKMQLARIIEASEISFDTYLLLGQLIGRLEVGLRK